jgi:hypothetical protein
LDGFLRVELRRVRILSVDGLCDFGEKLFWLETSMFGEGGTSPF